MIVPPIRPREQSPRDQFDIDVVQREEKEDDALSFYIYRF